MNINAPKWVWILVLIILIIIVIVLWKQHVHFSIH